MEHVYQSPSYSHGNRCGHVAAWPMLYQRSERKAATYATLHTALDNLSVYYSDPSKYLKSLKHTRYNRDKNDARIVWPKNQQRSESRESCARILGLLIDCCDYKTMQVVRFKNGKPEPITLLYIAMYFGISYQRVYRALKCLRDAGYVQFEYRSCYIGQQFIRIPAIKFLSRKVFTDLGISHLKLELDMHHARTRGEKRPRPTHTSSRQTFSKPIQTAGELIRAKLATMTDIPPAEDSIAAAKRKLAHFKPPPS